MSVGTRGKAAVLSRLEHFREVESDFLLLQIHESEASDARSVDDESTCGEAVHFVEGGRMASLLMSIGNLTHTRFQSRIQRFDERRLANSGDSREKGYMSVHHISEFVHTLACVC